MAVIDRDALVAQIRAHEGVRLFPYTDTTGHLTIGCGRNLTDVGISMSEADMLLGNDLTRAEADLDAALPWFRDLCEARQRALIELTFNLGVQGLLQFRWTLAHLRAGEYESAAGALLASRWAQQVGPHRSARIATMIREGR